MPPIKTELLGDGGVYRQLKKALMERASGAELTHHLGYEKGAAPAGRARGNSRNGRTGKTVLTDDGQIELSIPRDQAGTFEPKLVPKGVTRLEVSTAGSSAFMRAACRYARSRLTSKICMGPSCHPI